MKKQVLTNKLMMRIGIIVLSVALLYSPIASALDLYDSSNEVLFFDPTLCLVQGSSASISGLTASAATGSAGTGLSAKLMEIKDPNKFADAINQWITKQYPDSPLRDKGKFAVAGGQRAGINPILPIIIASMETQLGTTNAPGYNNPRYVGLVSGGVASYNGYGRTATASQPHVGGSKYLFYKWDSWQESLYSTSTSSTDMYQYLAATYKTEIDQGITQVMMKYAPPFENDTAAYIANLNKWAGEIYTLAGDSIDSSKLGAATTGTLTTSASGSTTCSPSTTSGTGTSGTAGPNGWDISGPNGMTIYYQVEDPWKSQSYGIGTIKECGCAPTSMAMAAATLNKDSSITPKTMADFFASHGGQIGGGSCGSNWIWDNGGGVLASQYHLKITNISTDMNKARDAIKRGSLVLMSQNPGLFTSSGHILLIRGISGNNFTVADPASRSNTEKTAGFTEQQISASLAGMWEISK